MGPQSASLIPETTWSQVAAELDAHIVAGLELLLTEDVLRFATVKTLARLGVPPRSMRVEWRAAVLERGAIDLAIGDPPTVAIEFKYAREPVETNAAWTQQLGEMLKDFYRLAVPPPSVQARWCVQLLWTRLRAYLERSGDCYGVRMAARPRPADVVGTSGGTRPSRHGAEEPRSVRGLRTTGRCPLR